jgi:hypothetical protein
VNAARDVPSMVHCIALLYCTFVPNEVPLVLRMEERSNRPFNRIERVMR